MDSIIKINNLNYKINDKIIFNDLNLNIVSGSFNTIIGANNSGKSTLSRIIAGIILTDSSIQILNKELNRKNKREIQKNISYIPFNSEDSIIMDTVNDELMLSCRDVKYLSKLINEFSLESILNKNPNELSGGQKQLIYFISEMARKPQLIIIDDGLSMLDNLIKDKIFKYLKKINRENKITILNITNDTEEIIYSEYVAIIDDGQILINDKTNEILKHEDLFKKLNLDLPFMVELSNKLKYYELIEKLELDIDKLVNKLWK